MLHGARRIASSRIMVSRARTIVREPLANGGVTLVLNCAACPDGARLLQWWRASPAIKPIKRRWSAC